MKKVWSHFLRTPIAFAKYENIMIATITQLPKYKILQKKYPEYQRLLRKRTEDIIPEILTLKSNNQELLDATLSFGFYLFIFQQKTKFKSNFSIGGL